MNKVKPLILIVGILLYLFGFIGFVYPLSFSNKTETFYEVRTINDRNGLAIDSHGNFYIGDGEKNNIQVFSNTGNFLYGLTIDTNSGSFNFGIDSNDIIHVITVRNNLHLKFRNGELISEEIVDYDRKEEIREMYKMSDGDLLTNWTTGSTYKKDLKNYKLTLGKDIKVYDSISKTSEIIPLDIPIWPFSNSVFWLIGVIGLGLIFWSYGWACLKKLHPKYKK